MRKLKAAVIGAGSTYTPELIEGFIDRKESLDFGAFALMDIDREKLETVGGLARRMLKAKGFTGELTLTEDLDSALEGADYVFSQIRVGGMAARIRDEKIPLRYNLLGQETTGAGGFMKALRTVPVMLDIARKIEEKAPDAWLINFSNPSGIVAEALLRHTRVKTIGLCNGPINMLADIAKRLGTDDFDYDYVGLNHLAWITSVTREGKNVLSEMKQGAGGHMKNIPELNYDPRLLAAIPAIPSSYLSYYYLRDQQLEKAKSAEKTRGEVCVELEESLLAKYREPSLQEKPTELASRGGALYSTAAVSVADAIENDRGEFHVINCQNKGALPFLEPDEVVEIKCRLGRSGAEPVAVTEHQNPYIVSLIRSVKAYERLTVSAAISGSREEALLALMAHPLIGDFDRASGVLEEMIAANIEYLPQFRR